MGVNVIVKSQKYYNEFNNGEDFNSNLSSYTNNFTGSVMENQMVRLSLSVSWGALSSNNNTFQVVSTTYTRPIGNWSDDGLAVGDQIYIWYFDSTGAYHGPWTPTISSISGSSMEISSIAAPSGGYSLMTINGYTPLTALIHKFSLIENSDNFSTQNLITGSDSAYYGSGMFDGGPWVDFQGLGQNKDWEDGTFRCRKLMTWGFEQRFEIEHKLLIPFYAEGDDLTVLPPYLDGLNSLKYAFESGFRSVMNDPNTQKSQRYDSQLGSVGGYNENFNGFDNNYEIQQISYSDAQSGSNASGILIAGKTKVDITVKKLIGTFSPFSEYGVYVGYKAEQADYQNTVLSNFKENFIYDRSLSFSTSPVVNGDVFITDNTAVIVGTDLIDITFYVEYDFPTKSFLSNKFNSNITEFVIGVNIGDKTKTAGNSDRVMLLAANTLYDESPDIEGLMNVNLFDIYPHDKQIASSNGYSDMTAWNEDGLAVDFDFDIDLNKDAHVNNLDFKLLAQNPTTGNIFELDSFNYPIAGAVVSGGVQQFNITTTRGYTLKNNDQFNDVTINVGSNIGGVQSYNGRFAQKVSWQEWIQNLDVNTIFYDSGEPFNNFNDKASNYSALNGYEIKLAISANLFGTNSFGVSGLTDYLFLSPALKVFDYKEDGLIPAVWSGVIETFNPLTSVSLGGAILTGQNTLFRTTWTNSNGAVTSLADMWGINRIEIANQLGYDITEMSSINDPATNQLLIPSNGTKLDMYLSGGNVVMDCLIDGALASSGVNYNLSSRINKSNTSPFLKATSPNSIQKDTSGVIDSKNTA